MITPSLLLASTLLVPTATPDALPAAPPAAGPHIQDGSGDRFASDGQGIAARLTGNFRYVGGERQRQELRDAIEVAVQQLNFLIRGIGRSRLEAVTQIPQSVRYNVTANTIEMQYHGRPIVSAPADGTYVQRTDPQGKPMRVSFSFQGETLVQRFKGENGVRTNTVTVNEDGSRMTVRVSIKSDRLEEPLRYRLSYERG